MTGIHANGHACVAVNDSRFDVYCFDWQLLRFADYVGRGGLDVISSEGIITSLGLHLSLALHHRFFKRVLTILDENCPFVLIARFGRTHEPFVMAAFAALLIDRLTICCIGNLSSS